MKYLGAIFCCIFIASIVSAADYFKLPFKGGEKFSISRGYDTPDSHKKTEKYALDFVQEKCLAFRKEAVATADGIVEQSTYSNGYGNYVLLKHDNLTYSLYGHLDEIVKFQGQSVSQGETVGLIGNSGKVIGEACKEHGGTHLHFAVYTKNETGSLVAYKPEPISGYTNLLAGNWYTSDNHLAKSETEETVAQKKESWLTKLWNKVKLVFNRTESAIEKGNIKVEAVTSNFNTNVSTETETSQGVTKNQEIALNQFVKNNSTIAAPSKSSNLAITANSNSQTISTTSSVQVINSTTSATSNNLNYSTPYPGYGGGGGGQSTQPPATSNIESNNSISPESQNSATSSTNELVTTNPPAIVSPSNQSIFSTSTINFYGTSTIGSIIFAEGFDEIAIADSSGNWNLALTLLNGTSSLNFFAIENNKATSSATSIEINVDTTPPTISLAIVECQYSLIEVGCALPLSTTTAILNTNENATTTLYMNGELVAETTEFSTSTLLNFENGNYEIYAVSSDLLGNISTSTVQNITIFRKPLVINEIAWAGTSESAFNEWIELESQTDLQLAMNRFSIEAKDQVLEIDLTGILDSYGYYLVERTDDDTVPTIAGSLITPFSGSGGGSGLSNSGEELFLIYHMGENSVVIDKTPEVNVCGGWCNASARSDGTMIRLNPSRDGSLQNAWGDDPNTYVPVFDSTGIQIAGTPKAGNYSNSIGTY